MYMPTIFHDDFFDDLMSFPFEGAHTQSRKPQEAAMRADVKETETGYQLELELPGFTKDELSAKLEDGYLTVTASHEINPDVTPKVAAKERYLRRERYLGSYARRFFVGKYLTQSDMKAKFENGLLILTFPKEDTKKVEEAKFISIEG